MFRLLIVEDDAVIRQNLQNNFDWERVGFEICGTATDGLDALNQMQAQMPDVILTDVEMPRMSGLDLLRVIIDRDYPIRTVFLSAYDDYPYVRDSLRLGAVDYLLKPLQPEMAYELFRKIGISLSENMRSQNSEKAIRKMTEDALPQAILNDLIKKRNDLDNIHLLLQHFGIPSDSPLTLASLRFNSSADSSVLQDHLKKLKHVLVANPLVMPFQGYILTLFPCQKDNAQQILESLLSCGALSYQCVLMQHTVVSALPDTFQKLCLILRDSFFLPLNRIIQQDSMIPIPSGKLEDLPGKESYLSCFLDHDWALLQKTLAKHAYLCGRFRYNPDLLIMQIAEVYHHVSDQLLSFQPRLSVQPFEDLFFALQTSFCFDSLFQQFQDVMEKLYEDYSLQCSLKGNLIEQVQAYIRRFYAQPLTLSTISKQFYVTPSHLSSAFSKRTGITLTDYIRNIRLDEAAKMLLRTNASVSEISSAVGYDNYKHFGKLFKDQYHLTPTEYRILCKGHDREGGIPDNDK